MADTRDEQYPSTEGATSQAFEPKRESPHKILVMNVDAEDTGGSNDGTPEKMSDKLRSPTSRTLTSKSDNPILGAARFGSSFGSKPFALRQSSFGTGRFGNGSPTSSCLTSSLKQVVLRPSQLAVGSSDSPISDTSTPCTNNPFARVPATPEDCEENVKKSDVQNKDDDKKSDSTPETSEEKLTVKDNISALNAASSPPNPLPATPKFVPLGSPVTQKDEPSASGSSSKAVASVTGFVFGQNLHERVEVAKAAVPEPAKIAPETPSSSSSSSAPNGTSEMLFSSVIRKETTTEASSSSNSSSSTCENTERPCKSLSEAAREYEEARAVKRKYEEVTVVTGEEDESNVLQLNCKLFAFDKDTWVERGRGNLRLNDKEIPGKMQSRVVVRTTGSLRVVLNTKIWAGMVVERASAKSIRLTAMDNAGQIKVFLVMASPKEIEVLYETLCDRIDLQYKLQNVAKAQEAEEAALKRRLLEADAPVAEKREIKKVTID